MAATELWASPSQQHWALHGASGLHHSASIPMMPRSYSEHRPGVAGNSWSGSPLISGDRAAYYQSCSAPGSPRLAQRRRAAHPLSVSVHDANTYSQDPLIVRRETQRRSPAQGSAPLSAGYESQLELSSGSYESPVFSFPNVPPSPLVGPAHTRVRSLSAASPLQLNYGSVQAPLHLDFASLQYRDPALFSPLASPACSPFTELGQPLWTTSTEQDYLSHSPQSPQISPLPQYTEVFDIVVPEQLIPVPSYPVAELQNLVLPSRSTQPASLAVRTTRPSHRITGPAAARPRKREPSDAADIPTPLSPTSSSKRLTSRRVNTSVTAGCLTCSNKIATLIVRAQGEDFDESTFIRRLRCPDCTGIERVRRVHDPLNGRRKSNLTGVTPDLINCEVCQRDCAYGGAS